MDTYNANLDNQSTHLSSNQSSNQEQNFSNDLKVILGHLNKVNYINYTFNRYNNITKHAPQVIFKVIKGAPKGSAVKKLIDYIAMDNKSERALVDEMGTEYITKDDRSTIYQQWKKDFDNRANGKDALHFVFSCKTDHQNVHQLLSSAQKVMTDNFGLENYKYLIAYHQHGSQPHVHVVLNIYNELTKKKFNFLKNDPLLFKIRSDFATELSARGIQRAATLQQDRESMIDRSVKQSR